MKIGHTSEIKIKADCFIDRKLVHFIGKSFKTIRKKYLPRKIKSYFIKYKGKELEIPAKMVEEI